MGGNIQSFTRVIEGVLKAFHSQDGPTQKAVTRRLLTDLAQFHEPLGVAAQHTANLIVGA